METGAGLVFAWVRRFCLDGIKPSLRPYGRREEFRGRARQPASSGAMHCVLVMATLQFVTTQRGHRKVILDGYIYLLDKKLGQKTYRRCEDRICTPRLHSMGDVIVRPPSEHNSHAPSSTRFFYYFESNYIGNVGRGGRRRQPLFPPSLWSQYQRTVAGLPRTNDSVEGSHNTFRGSVNKVHLSVRALALKLQREEVSVAALSECLGAGHQLPMPQKKYRLLNGRVQSNWILGNSQDSKQSDPVKTRRRTFKFTSSTGQAPPIGIDLGTTYSCVGVFQQGEVKIIRNDKGELTTPSYVAFTDTCALIGDDAKNQIPRNPTNTIFGE
ncbi:unnamed protein product [Darwinula stevensoni]|uniref:FLYWCH-type domain-containing protein n=1 Tax=Darwinula stevensoni TaxID=69355 RepID=A0A7R9A2F6_9CRUS|nr:unnamed protein product [Darwinula stevensoni]CAG0885555.1 unnamed protein product [Darwinula stevensoni]